MSKNLSKLEVKSELLRHLATATTMKNNGATSSELKVMTLNVDLDLLALGGDPNLRFWEKWLSNA